MIWRSNLSFEPASAVFDDEILRTAASGRALTFGQLADGVRRLAARPAGSGIGRGDVGRVDTTGVLLRVSMLLGETQAGRRSDDHFRRGPTG
jgi:hypothetical protein